NVRVEVSALKLFKSETAVHLEPKAFEVLIYLIENRGRLIEKKELLDEMWKEAFVTENAMTRVIAQLRKALNDDSKQAKYIETAPTRAYRFIAEVEVREQPETGKVKDIGIESGSTDGKAAQTAAKTSPSIAVLPFVNMSAEAENEYFCDGLAEELLNAL